MSITLNSKIYTWTGFNQNAQGVYSERSGGYPSAFSYLTTKVNTGTGKSDSTVKWNLSVPIVATTDSDCSCAGDPLRTSYVRIELQVPAGSSSAERTDLATRVKELVASAEFQASITNLTQPAS